MSSLVVETQRIRAGRSAWESALTTQIIDLEDNLDELYQTAGLKANRILQLDQVNNHVNHNNHNNMDKDKEQANYEDVINNQLSRVQQSATNICTLINSVTEFDLPLPAYVLLRLATRLASLRWTDYSKKSGGSLAKRYAYSKSTDLISVSLMMYKWISYPLGTNIIPFQPFINQNILNILEWTRASSLSTHNQVQFLTIRSQVFNLISDGVEQLSLNLNLDSKQLKTLIQIELVGSLAEEFTNMKRTSIAGLPQPTPPINSTTATTTFENHEDEPARLKDKYVVDALSCLEKLFIVYGEYLDAQLEHSLKTFVIQACIDIYRDFERNVIGLASRRQLLRLLETIANQPYATSTTEVGWHLFELAATMETDPDIRKLARRSLKLGLAHRPVIVSHHDVYNCHSRPMTSATDDERSSAMLIDGKQQPEAEESDHHEQERNQVECYLPVAEVSATPEEETGPQDSNMHADKQDVEEDKEESQPVDEQGECNEHQAANESQPSQPGEVKESEQAKDGQPKDDQPKDDQPKDDQPAIGEDQTAASQTAEKEKGEESPVDVEMPIENEQQDIDIVGPERDDKTPQLLRPPSPSAPPAADAKPLDCASDKPEDDPEVQTCMSLFVSKPAC